MENNPTQYMYGTEGSLDYIVIANHETLSIGIKPVLIQQNPMQVFMGFRVRCHDNNQEQVITDVQQFLEDHPTLFAWEKVNAKRASSMLGALFPLPYAKEPSQLMESLKESGFFQQLLDQLAGIFQIYESPEVIHSFMKAHIQAQVYALAGKFMTIPQPEDYEEQLAELVADQNQEDNDGGQAASEG